MTSSQPRATQESHPLEGDPQGTLVWDWIEPTTPCPSPSLLVLINGFQRTRMDFRAMRRRLHEQCPWLVTLSLDNRGVGETTTTQPFTLDDMAGDVVFLVRKATERWSRAQSLSLLGISMGGMIAQRAAARLCKTASRDAGTRAPDRVFLVSTTAGGAHRFGSANNRVLSRDPNPRDAASTGPQFAQDFPAHLERMRRYFGSRFLSTSSLLVETLAKNTFKSATQPAEQDRARAQWHASVDFDGSQDLVILKEQGVKCSVLCGDEDHIMPLENSQKLADLLPGLAELVVYPKAGHLLLIEEPESFAGDVVARLSQDRQD